MSELTRKDFASDQEVRWCPGCGDYAVLASLQRVFPSLGIPRENIVFVSGIGCAARFPYYMNTYGFHTIHGRAPALATGLKLSRPELSVWVVTGDGDGLSIGANHLLHALRRNIDLKVLLFNNKIYGLTKGQYSPTSEVGKVTGTTPLGSLDNPVNPIEFALTAGATFVARCIDTDAKHLQAVITAAAKHKGSAVIEILQNCNIFNDGAFADVTDKATRDDRVIYVEDKQPLVFGKTADQALTLDGYQLKKTSVDNAKKHDVTQKNIAHLLSQCAYPDLPVPLGVLYQKTQPTYDEQFTDRLSNTGDLADLLSQGAA